MKLGIPLEDYTFEVKEIIESATEKWIMPEMLHKYKLHDLKTALYILNKTGSTIYKSKNDFKYTQNQKMCGINQKQTTCSRGRLLTRIIVVIFALQILK